MSLNKQTNKMVERSNKNTYAIISKQHTTIKLALYSPNLFLQTTALYNWLKGSYPIV